MENIENMLRIARGNVLAYHMVSERLEKEREKLNQGKEAEEDKLELCFPAIMLLSFSCELYLKILITKKGLTYGRNHDLLSLYEILDADSRRKIREYCGERDETYFRDTLRLNKDVFPEWRYFYEIELNNKPGNIAVVDAPFLDNFLTGLEKMNEELSDTNEDKLE